jgi:hypothetical protein
MEGAGVTRGSNQATSPGRAARQLIEHGVDHASLGAVSTKACAAFTYSEADYGGRFMTFRCANTSF